MGTTLGGAAPFLSLAALYNPSRLLLIPYSTTYRRSNLCLNSGAGTTDG
jgi:hypothetical protein